MDWTILWWLLAALVVIAGLAGTVVPALPGVPLVFAGLFLGAWIDGNLGHSVWLFALVITLYLMNLTRLMAVLTLLAGVIDFVAGAAGARYLGAGSRAFWGATAGAIVGIFFGIPGMLLGPFIGAMLGELSGGNDLVRSGRAGIGAWLGVVVATAIKLAIAFLMIGLFLFRVGFEQISAG